MSQPRRPSTTTKLGKHPLSPNDLNQAAKTSHTTSSQAGPQAKHRRLSTNQNRRDPVVKRDMKVPSDVPHDELKPVTQVQEETTVSPAITVSQSGGSENGVRSVVSEKLYPGARIKMRISLPSTGSMNADSDFKHIVTSAETSDDLESTSKGDLTFSIEDPDIAAAESSSTPEENCIAAPVKEISSPVTEIAPSDVETGTTDAGEKTQSNLGNETPSSTATMPKAPPTTPATPKREIKLVTASSSAADWFASGTFSTVQSKREHKPPTGTQTALVKLDEPGPTTVEPDPGTFQEETSGKNEGQLEQQNATVDIPLTVTPVVDGGQTSSPPIAAGQTILIDATVSFAFSFCRPYVLTHRDPLPTVTEVKTPVIIPADPIIPPASPESVTEDDVAEDASEESIEVIKEPIPTTDEMEGVKRRWFREEMRQSANRDGSWTVEDEGEKVVPGTDNLPSDFEFVDNPMMASIPGHTKGDVSPVEIHIDPSDVVLVEPVFVASDAASNTTHGDTQILKQKFVIRGGTVVRTPEIPKVDLSSVEDAPISEPMSAVQTHPMRKQGVKTKNFDNESVADYGSSDGWSTECEEGMESFTPTRVAGSATAVSVSDISHNSEFVEAEVQTEDLKDPETPDVTTSDISISPLETPSTSTQEAIETPIELDTSDTARETTNKSTAVEASAETQGSTSLPSVMPEQSGKVRVQRSEYRIISGKVHKVTYTPIDDGGSVITVQHPDATGPPMSPTLSTSSQQSSEAPTPARRTGTSKPLEGILKRVQETLAPKGVPVTTPDAAKKFIECGDMADRVIIGALTRDRAPWPGSPHHTPVEAVVVGQLGAEHSVLDPSQFGYGKAKPINQPSVREEKFDPYGHETPKNLKQFKEKYPPLLESLDTQRLRRLLEKDPHCFCDQPCSKFDGIVPVFVCGIFRKNATLQNDARGCAFHMHVPFWQCLRDTYFWTHFDKDKTFSSDVLIPHLNACPYLNFTFCVKFSQRNNLNMYLPAEIRATNTCACDMDMRLDFSETTQQWTFSCPHYHRQGAQQKCVRRVFVQESRYKLLDTSPNLHGGGMFPVEPQTIAEEEKKSHTRLQPVVHLPQMENTISRAEAVEEEDESDIFKSLYRTATLNDAGSRDWLGEKATEEQLAEWERQKQEWEKERTAKVDKMREQYLQLEKMLDEVMCDKIKDEEQRKREEAKLRLKANVVPCVACCEVSAMCVFIPCFHMVMCEKCADKVNTCPSCRKPVETRQRVYTA